MQRFALIFCICCHAALAQAANYTYQLIDYPGASSTFVNGINNAGTIVGSFQSDAGRRGFLYDGSNYTEFSYPGANWTELNGINNLGHLVGSYRNGDHSVGFVFDGTDFETFSVEGGVVVPRDLNDLGQVVGHYLEEIPPGKVPRSGFLWQNGAFSFVEVEGADVSWIDGINNLGQFVGGYRQSDSLLPNAFRWTGDAYEFIEVPGRASYLSAINLAGNLLAQTLPGKLVSPSSSTVFLSLDGSFEQMDVPAPPNLFGETGASGEDLNDQRYFVGSYRDGNRMRGYLAIPVPEPATVWLAALAIAGIATRSKRISKGAREVVVSRLLAAGDVFSPHTPSWASAMQRFALIFCICCHAALAQAANYTYQLIDYPGASSTFVNGINNAGTIVGSFDSDAGRRGFLYDGSTYSEFNYPGANGTELRGINNLGHLLGTYATDEESGAFIFDGVTYTTFDIPDSMMFPTDLNDLGQVVGQYLDATPGGYSINSHGFLWQDGTLTTIDLDGVAATWISGINNLGQYVGGYRLGGYISYGFLSSNGSITAVSAPGETSSLAAINSSGSVLANSSKSPLTPHAALTYVDAGNGFELIEFPAPTDLFGYSLAAGADLNDFGLVVGSYRDGNTMRGYLAIPVPEPATFWLAALAIAGIATRSKTISKGRS